MKTIAYDDFKRLIDLLPSARPKFYASEDADELVHGDLDEAIEAGLDDRENLDLTGTLTVIAASPVAISPEYLSAERVLDHLELLIEDLDDEYGPEENPPPFKPGEHVLAAAHMLAEAIRKEYHVWRCETNAKIEVPIGAWVRANAPDWIKEEDR